MKSHLGRRLARRALSTYSERRSVWRLRAWTLRAHDARGRAFSALRRVRSSAIATARAGRGVVGRILFSCVLAGLSLAFVWWMEQALGRPWEVSGTTHDVFFETLGGVTGVFLGLYFAAVSTVAATAYAHVPTEARDLLVREKLGNTYVLLVAFLTTFSLGALAFHALGGDPLGLAVWLGVAFAALAVFAFVELGRRAFQFFDPVALGDLALSDLFGGVQSAMALRRRPSHAVAAEARQQADRAVGALDSLVDVAATQQRSSRAVHGLLGRRLYAASRYQLAKTAIPTADGWFGTRFEHRQWFLAGSSALHLARATSVSLQPEGVPDLTWLEDRLRQPVEEEIERAAEGGDIDALWRVMPAFSEVVKVSGATFDVTPTLRWLGPVLSVVEQGLAVAPSTVKESDVVKRVALADLIASLPMQLELGIYRRLADMGAAELGSALDEVDVTEGGAHYRLSHELALPRSCIEALERVAVSRSFEETAQVGFRTPDWYVRDTVINPYIWAISQEWLSAFRFALGFYRPLADRLAGGGRHLEAAAVRARALETSWKLGRHVSLVAERDAQLRASLVLTDLQQPSWDPDALIDDALAFRLGVLQDIAESIPELATIAPRDANMPDYLGEAVHRAGEACFDALIDDDLDLFDAIFQPYFVGIVSIVERLRSRVADWRPEVAAPWIAAPVIDLMTISGYAYVFGALKNEQQPIATVATAWDRWLMATPDGLDVLDSLITIDRGTFAIQPRSVLRTAWKQRLQQVLDSLPRRAVDSRWEEDSVDHPSALIRELRPHRRGFMLYDALDVFVGVYLRGRLDVGGRNFSGVGEGLVGLDARHSETGGGGT